MAIGGGRAGIDAAVIAGINNSIRPSASSNSLDASELTTLMREIKKVLKLDAGQINDLRIAITSIEEEAT
ncbi:hypothetical protein KKC60_00120 [Patescibacteria group bacterium]|nr:hypothetical protein [Patescibacteria group bacterium]